MQEEAYDLAAETGVLAGLLIYGQECMCSISANLSGADFFHRGHRAIYEAAQALFETGRPIDEIGIVGVLRDAGMLDKIGGATFVTALSEAILAPAQVEHYARRLREKSVARRAQSLTTAFLSTVGHQGVESPVEIVMEHISALSQLVASSGLNASEDGNRKAVEKALTAYEQRRLKGVDQAAMSTGIRKLDRALGGGIRPARLYTVAGRPGMGKTSMALEILYNLAVLQGRPCLYVNLEQPAQELIESMICAQVGISTTDWYGGRPISEEKLQHRDYVANRIRTAPIYWEPTATSPQQILARAQQVKASHGGELALIVLDHIQKMSVVMKGYARPLDKINQAIGMAKHTAMALETPFLVVSQLNRDCESRKDKRGKPQPIPVLSDLKATGNIEEDSDVVLFLYRPSYYRAMMPDTPDCDDRLLAQIIVAKQRMGAAGMALRINFIGECVKFMDREE